MIKRRRERERERESARFKCMIYPNSLSREVGSFPMLIKPKHRTLLHSAVAHTHSTHTHTLKDMAHYVVLNGPAPWGFRLIGGKDFNQPLTIAKISPGSKASMVDLSPGDIILAIDGISTGNMMHCEAQTRMKQATQQLRLTIQRPEPKLWSPRLREDGRVHPFKMNLEAERQEYRPIGIAHNRRAAPFVAAANIDDKHQVVSSAYNSPIGLYSTGNIQDALHGQLRGLIHNKPESPRTLTSIEESDVYRMLQKGEEEHHEPRQSGSFKALQDYINNEGTLPVVTKTVQAPSTKALSPGGNLHKLPMCDKCGNGIVGMVVKVHEKYRHPGCFVCSVCEENLKQKGYFFIDDEIYCETHAHTHAKPPESPDL